jgi:type I restriction enzyme S subunit
MSGDELSVEGLLRTSPRIDRAYARSKVRTGEIVCAIRATVGKVLPVPPTLDGANLTQGTARIAPSPDINPSYLLWALRSPRVQREFGLAVKGTTFAEITLEALREIPVPRPRAREEQDVIAATLDGIEQQILTEKAQLNKLQAVKSGVSTDVLSGRVRVAT